VITIEPKYKKLGKVCDKTKIPGATARNYIYINTIDKKAVATNGHIMAIVPIKVGDEENHLVSPEFLFKDAKRFGAYEYNVEKSEFGDRTVGIDKKKSELIPDLVYPNYKDVIPDFSDYEARISFNAVLLKDLADALGSESVALTIKLNAETDSKKYTTKIMKVEALNDKEVVGYIMPVRNNS